MSWELLSDYTARNVTLGCALLGAVGGGLGTLAVLRQQSLIGDVAAHATLPGIAAAFLLMGKRDPLALFVGGLLSSAAAVLLVGWLSRTRLGGDGALGVSLGLFFGLGLVLMTVVAKSGNAAQAGLASVMFGQAAALTAADLRLFLVVGGLAMSALLLLQKEIGLFLFDPTQSEMQGHHPRHLGAFCSLLIVLAVAIGVQAVGVLMMAALLIAPSVAARQWARSWRALLASSAAFGALGAGGGAALGLLLGAPTGASAVLMLCSIALLSLCFAPKRGLLWTWKRGRKARKALREQARQLETT